MFTKVKQFITKVGVMLGIIQELEKVTQHKKVNMPDEFYQKIIQWKELHKGYHKDLHCVTGHSIERGSFQRDLATLNMPKVVSQELASLIFNERANISVTANDNFEAFVEDIFLRNGFSGNFQQYLEFMFAQGGMAIKPYVNGGQIDLSYSTAETFIPISWDNNKIREAVFPSYITKNKKYYTLLEWHTFNDDGLYTVKNELFVSQMSGTLGVKTNLSELYPDLTEEVVFGPEVDIPLFVYFKPNTANNLDTTLPLGISLYANSYDTLRLIDTIYDSFIREYKLGRKRLIIPTDAIKAKPDSSGNLHRYFDAQDETYEAIDVGGLDSTFMQEVDSTLRIQEHVDGLNAALNSLSTQIGFSQGTFSFDAGGGLKTATEVVSENSKTFRTKKSHENLIEQRLTDLIEVIALLGDQAGLIVKPDEIEVTVSFDDSIIQDKNAEADNQIKLIGSGLQSKIDAMVIIYGISEEEAQEKLAKILQEQRMDMPDLESLKSSLTLNGGFE